jgi:hypothetical protein
VRFLACLLLLPPVYYSVCRSTPRPFDTSGQIVGPYYDGSTYHGFLDNGGTYTTIDPPGSTGSTAYVINTSGQIAGYYVDGSGFTHGFLDNGGTYTTIDPPGSTSTIVDGINDSG